MEAEDCGEADSGGGMHKSESTTMLCDGAENANASGSSGGSGSGEVTKMVCDDATAMPAVESTAVTKAPLDLEPRDLVL